mmetsp:Transcript_100626/g.259845  ORF Transcript_100626/g.259845 Transcript_100626/m.259845 type:complete len:168 (+) Transcript_100626:95-598(+)
MAGHGYLVAGLFALLPSLAMVAYIIQHPRFRQDMSKRDAVTCWACMLSAFTFPITCGFTGQHKRQLTLLLENPAKLVSEPYWLLDRYFVIAQMHMFWILVSFLLWQQLDEGTGMEQVPPSGGMSKASRVTSMRPFRSTQATVQERARQEAARRSAARSPRPEGAMLR